MSNQQYLSGSQLPLTQIWDVSEVYNTEVEDPERLKELLVRMYQNLSLMANAVNNNEIGYYNTIQYSCGQQFFPNTAANVSQSMPYIPFRRVLRLVVNFGALLNTAAKTVPHGITTSAQTIFTRIYATATDPVGMNYIPLPYASSTAASNIELSVNNTNVTITTGSDRTNFTICYVILEYLQF